MGAWGGFDGVCLCLSRWNAFRLIKKQLGKLTSSHISLPPSPPKLEPAGALKHEWEELSETRWEHEDPDWNGSVHLGKPSLLEDFQHSKTTKLIQPVRLRDRPVLKWLELSKYWDRSELHESGPENLFGLDGLESECSYFSTIPWLQQQLRLQHDLILQVGAPPSPLTYLPRIPTPRDASTLSTHLFQPLSINAKYSRIVFMCACVRTPNGAFALLCLLL